MDSSRVFKGSSSNKRRGLCGFGLSEAVGTLAGPRILWLLLRFWIAIVKAHVLFMGHHITNCIAQLAISHFLGSADNSIVEGFKLGRVCQRFKGTISPLIDTVDPAYNRPGSRWRLACGLGRGEVFVICRICRSPSHPQRLSGGLRGHGQCLHVKRHTT